MNDGLKEVYRQSIIDIISANPRVERAVLFGSRAMGSFTPTSDIDIVLFGDILTLDDQAQLTVNIADLPIPQRVDLLLYNQIKNRELLEHISRHGVVLYKKNLSGSTAVSGESGVRQDTGSDRCPLKLKDGHMKPIDIKPSDLKAVLSILSRYVPEREVRAFGSRVSWTAGEFSDLDLVVMGDAPLPISILADLEEAFSESDLPFKVDIVDWATTKENFRRIIEQEYVVAIKSASSGSPISDSEWKSGFLSDFTDIMMGQSPAGNTCSTSKNNMPLLNGPTEFGKHHPYPVQFTTDPKKITKKGDILFCVRGSTTGQMNWGDQPYAIGRGIAAIRHLQGIQLQAFVRAVIDYNLSSLLISATGSTFPNVSRSQLLSLELNIPPIPEQRAIAHILGSLDDKIEMNRQMNETLEDMAKTIFKSWFVDFDPVHAKAKGQNPKGISSEIAKLFPDSFVESELGLIPKGWKIGNIASEFILVMGQSPPGKTYNEQGVGLPFFQGRRDFGFRFPSKRVYCSIPNRLANKGDTLISVRAPVGDINMALEKCCIGRGVASVKHKSNSRSYTYYAMNTLKDIFDCFEGEGTVFGSINKKNFESIEFISPNNDKLITSFEKQLFPFDEMIESNTLEINTLLLLRDTLLPKLISGELRIKDAEKFLEEKCRSMKKKDRYDTSELAESQL